MENEVVRLFLFPSMTVPSGSNYLLSQSNKAEEYGNGVKPQMTVDAMRRGEKRY